MTLRYSVALLTCLCAWASSPQSSIWTAARTAGLEVYSQGGAESARKLLTHFEQLQACFEQNGLISLPASVTPPPLRIFSFHSVNDYAAFRLRSNADGYYVGSEHQAYIVVPGMQSASSAIGTHEYGHYFFHAAGIKPPAWLDEGLAEFFSTVRFANRGCTLGGALPARLETLNRHKWLPLPQLLAVPAPAIQLQTREDAELFYAESWSFTSMLIDSPAYAPHFHDLIATLSLGEASDRALTATYRKSLDAITGDLHDWISAHHFTTLTYTANLQAGLSITISGLSKIQSETLMAELLTATGQLGRAESLYTTLSRESPGDPNNLAALGNIALREHDRRKALEYWRVAIDKGVSNADLCYRYALLADDAGSPSADIRRALKRTIVLRPDFDDARYKLALIESNTGDFKAAVAQLRAIHAVPPARAFTYWTTLSYASMELDDRAAAKSAAQEAGKCAQTVSDRVRANQLAYIADTDPAVHFVQDKDGHSRLVETRVPHGATEWNPFVEPTDQIRQVQGQLREVVCAGTKLTGLLVDTANGPLSLAVPDPQHVFTSNGPLEFTCGPQPPKTITVQYAAAYANATTQGVVRGIAFR